MIYHLSEHIVLFKSEHIPLFCFKELFLEVVAQAMNDRFMFERHCFMLQFTAFETDKSVGQCILLFRRDILFNNLNQIRQRHYGTADNKVERSFLLFCTGMAESYIFQSDGICHFGCYTYFLPILSTRWNFTSGNRIAKGMPGKPPPVPKSMMLVPGRNWMTLAMPNEWST